MFFFYFLARHLDCICDLSDCVAVSGGTQRHCRCRVPKLLNIRVLGLYEQYRHHTGLVVSAKDFGGMSHYGLVFARSA